MTTNDVTLLLKGQRADIVAVETNWFQDKVYYVIHARIPVEDLDPEPFDPDALRELEKDLR